MKRGTIDLETVRQHWLSTGPPYKPYSDELKTIMIKINLICLILTQLI